MALSPGYWPTYGQPDRYWIDDYWPDYGALVVPGAYTFYYSSSDILRTMNFTADILMTNTSKSNILMTVTSKVILGE
jgi:hypothetical protein